jgi:hypothetical protein
MTWVDDGLQRSPRPSGHEPCRKMVTGHPGGFDVRILVLVARGLLARRGDQVSRHRDPPRTGWRGATSLAIWFGLVATGIAFALSTGILPRPALRSNVTMQATATARALAPRDAAQLPETPTSETAP